MQLVVLSIIGILASLGGICVAETPKRVPSGFSGVRGKKSIPDSAFPDSVPDVTNNFITDASTGENVDKRAPSGFMGMRGKKPFSNPDVLSEGFYKRAPSGFLGMRGKKEMDMNVFDVDNKRAPSGFYGMRGKKDSDLETEDYDMYADKRAPSGFMGMRGKKEYESVVDELKRSPMSGFFGMRGKKQPGRSGFFGMRGKKYPYEFRGKFVGVRGKKSSDDFSENNYSSNNNIDEAELVQLAQGLDLNQLMLLLTANDNDNTLWENGKPKGYYRQEHVLNVQ